MKQVKGIHCTARAAGVVQHGLFAGLMLMAIVVADPAMAARRGKSGLPPGVQLAPVAKPEAQVPAVRPPGIKPILHPGRHGSKPRARAR